MAAVSAADWLLGEEAIAHISACIWYRKDGTLRLQLPLSMVARTYLQHRLEEGSTRARGPFQVPHDLPPKVLHWPVVEIPSAFWRGAVCDGRSGFRNRSRLELLPWFEVTKKELYEVWPEADRRTMPAPFNVDWPRLQDVIEAMMQRLDVNEMGACRRLDSEYKREAIRARNGRGSDGNRVVDEGEQVDLIAVSGGTDTLCDHEISATGRNGRRDAIFLCGEDVIALWPGLVLSESGEIAPPIAGWSGTRALEPSAVVRDAVFQADAGTPQRKGPESSEFSSLSGPLAPSVDQPPPTRSRTARLAERVALEFVHMFPDGRPAMKVKELMAQVRLRPGFGTVSPRTVEEALRLAWPRSH